MRKKRWAALLLGILMALQLSCPPAQAVGVYFVGAEENILPLTNDTMPFWNNGYLYVAGTVFTGTARESLKVSHVSTRGGKRIILYRNERHLLFEREVNYAKDESGNIYFPGAIMRDGVMFVPVSLVADYFGLEYSVAAVRYGFLVWLRQPGFGLSADHFADAASASIQDRYNDYVRQQESQDPPQQPSVPDTQEPEFSGKRLYLCFRADETASDLMDTLGRYGVQATFFCTPEFLKENDEMLRRMTGSGYGVGILADAAGESPVMEQLRAGNLALEQATGQKTRLARIENAGQDTMEEARAAGYCLTVSGMKKSRYTLESVNQANLLFQRVSASRGSSCVWLDSAVHSGGLAKFLSLAAAAEDPCLALAETAEIS